MSSPFGLANHKDGRQSAEFLLVVVNTLLIAISRAVSIGIVSISLVATMAAQITLENSQASDHPVAQPSEPAAQQGDQPAAGNAKSQDVEGDAGQFVFRKKVEEVVLHAVVVDQQNNLISDLGRSGFQVYEDGKAQQITSFHQEHVPVALGILIDNSGSMRPKREAVNQAALNLIRSSHPQDEIFVVNFGEEYYLDQDFTNDETKLRAALEKVELRGSTALIRRDRGVGCPYKAGFSFTEARVLVVTDGADNASQESVEEAVQQLQQKDSPVVYVIALLKPGKGETSTIRALQAMAKTRGARPTSRPTWPGRLPSREPSPPQFAANM